MTSLMRSGTLPLPETTSSKVVSSPKAFTRLRIWDSREVSWVSSRSSGPASSRTKRRASARFSLATSSMTANCSSLVAGSSVPRAARESSKIELRPCATVSWISRERRSRSSSRPAWCSLAASSAWVSRSCLAMSLWCAASACSRRWMKKTVAAKAVPISGPTAAAMDQLAGCSQAGMNAAAAHSTAMETNPGTVGKARRKTKMSGNSSHMKSCACTIRPSHRRHSPPSHNHVGSQRCAAYTTARAMAKPITRASSRSST